MRITMLLASAGLLVATSCSPANVMSSGTGGEPAADVKTACSDYAYAYCKQITTCSPTGIQIKYGTTRQCEAVQLAACIARISAPESSSTIATYAACQAALPSWTCSDFLNLQNPPPECQAKPGPRATGASCAVSAQCASAYCGGTKQSACGTCAVPPAAGDSCATSSCGPSFDCHGTPPVCIAYATAGTACSTAVPCAEGLTCVAGLCQPGVKTAGASCTLAGAGCDRYSGLSCDASVGMCVTLQLVGAGAACGTVVDQSVACIAGSCSRGVCVPFVPLGGACDVNGADCVAGTNCIVTDDAGTTGTCQVPGATACPG